MRAVSLFSGAGGFERAGIETVLQAEREPWRRQPRSHRRDRGICRGVDRAPPGRCRRDGAGEVSRSNRDDRGRYAPERGTLYPIGAPTFRRQVPTLAAIRSQEWLQGARDGWNEQDGPNPWLQVQLVMPIGEVA